MANTKKVFDRIIKGNGERNADFNDLCKRLEKLSIMSKYEIIIYWSNEDQLFIAEVPELPGCMADVKSHADALSHVEIVIQDWIETARSLGRTIPEPRGKLMYA